MFYVKKKKIREQQTYEWNGGKPPSSHQQKVLQYLEVFPSSCLPLFNSISDIFAWVTLRMSYSDQKQHTAQASLSRADFITWKKDLKIGS